jgi:hypothetical protein
MDILLQILGLVNSIFPCDFISFKLLTGILSMITYFLGPTSGPLNNKQLEKTTTDAHHPSHEFLHLLPILFLYSDTLKGVTKTE